MQNSTHIVNGATIVSLFQLMWWEKGQDYETSESQCVSISDDSCMQQIRPTS